MCLGCVSQLLIHLLYSRLIDPTYLQAGNTTFQFDIIPLLEHSEPLRNLFEIPPSESSEGTEANPVLLEEMESETFSNFLKWLNHMYMLPPQVLWYKINIYDCQGMAATSLTGRVRSS